MRALSISSGGELYGSPLSISSRGELVLTTTIEIADTGGGSNPYSPDISIFEREDIVMIAIIKEFMKRLY